MKTLPWNHFELTVSDLYYVGTLQVTCVDVKFQKGGKGVNGMLHKTSELEKVIRTI